MRGLEINKRTFHYAKYLSSKNIRDERGNFTGEKLLVYDTTKTMSANISPATGASNAEQFGNLEDYDKVIVITGVSPIDEHTVLFVDKAPEYATVTNYEDVESHVGEAEVGDTVSGFQAVTYQVPIYDYTVKRVAQSLNSVSIAISKVDLR